MRHIKSHSHNGNGHIPAYVLKLLAEQKDGLVKVDLGGGYQPQPGWINLDIQRIPGVDIVHDWEQYPWPFPDSSVVVIKASHVVEHVNPAQFGFINWMNEAWRILKVDGQLVISCPYAGSEGYWADPTHCNPCTKNTWRYFDPRDPDNLYDIYKPKPFKLKSCLFNVMGVMDVVMEKMRLDGPCNICKKKHDHPNIVTRCPDAPVAQVKK